MRCTWWLLPVLAGCSALPTGPFPHTSVPAAIAAPAGERLAMINNSQGVQIYRCDPKPDAPGRFAWTHHGSEASLFEEGGTRAGRHYDGTTWEALDGSKLVGTVAASVPAPDAGNAPWQRIAVRPSGTGSLDRYTTVLQVSTSGGAAPAACTSDDRGRILRVEYRADYYFYAPR